MSNLVMHQKQLIRASYGGENILFDLLYIIFVVYYIKIAAFLYSYLTRIDIFLNRAERWSIL